MQEVRETQALSEHQLEAHEVPWGLSNGTRCLHASNIGELLLDYDGNPDT